MTTTTQERPVERILPRLKGVRKTGDGQWKALCPSHPDRNPSLSVTETADHNLLVRCHANKGCDASSITRAIDRNVSDLFANCGDNGRGVAKAPPKPKRRWRNTDEIAQAFPGCKEHTVHEYHHADGTPAFLVVRSELADGKDFRPYHYRQGCCAFCGSFRYRIRSSVELDFGCRRQYCVCLNRLCAEEFRLLLTTDEPLPFRFPKTN